MAVSLRRLVPQLVAVSGVALFVVVPRAAADPVLSTSGSADSVIDALKDQGYNVEINWLNGFDPKPLSECRVTEINDPGNQPPSKATLATVYVDVMCPNHDD
jgi:hypothetical protein